MRDDGFSAHKPAHLKINRLFGSVVAQSANSQHRAWAGLASAVHAMEQIELRPGTVGMLAQAFKDTANPSEKAAHAIGLGLLGAESKGEILFTELQQSKDDALKGYICVGLGLMRFFKGLADRPRRMAAALAFAALCVALNAVLAALYVLGYIDPDPCFEAGT